MRYVTVDLVLMLMVPVIYNNLYMFHDGIIITICSKGLAQQYADCPRGSLSTIQMLAIFSNDESITIIIMNTL